MSKPLIAQKPMADKAKNQRKAAAAEFHRRVFAAHGSKCYFCGGRATDAMHIWGRSSRLGPHRYAFPEENGRSGCRPCHDTVGRYTRNFKLADRKRAASALNKVLTVKITLGEIAA